MKLRIFNLERGMDMRRFSLAAILSIVIVLNVFILAVRADEPIKPPETIEALQKRINELIGNPRTKPRCGA